MVLNGVMCEKEPVVFVVIAKLIRYCTGTLLTSYMAICDCECI